MNNLKEIQTFQVAVDSAVTTEIARLHDKIERLEREVEKLRSPLKLYRRLVRTRNGKET